jgi:hypothetical protein
MLKIKKNTNKRKKIKKTKINENKRKKRLKKIRRRIFYRLLTPKDTKKHQKTPKGDENLTN